MLRTTMPFSGRGRSQIAIWARRFSIMGISAPRKRNETHRAQIEGLPRRVASHRGTLHLQELLSTNPAIERVTLSTNPLKS